MSIRPLSYSHITLKGDQLLNFQNNLTHSCCNINWQINGRESYEIVRVRPIWPAPAHNVLFLSPSSPINYSKSDPIRYSEVKTERCIFEHSPADRISIGSIASRVRFQENNACDLLPEAAICGRDLNDIERISPVSHGFVRLSKDTGQFFAKSSSLGRSTRRSASAVCHRSRRSMSTCLFKSES